MNSGAGGSKSNSGSCAGLVEYLEHENIEKKYREIDTGEAQNYQKFFNQKSDDISKTEVIEELDKNKGQLKKTDDKYYSVIVSPTKDEISKMGITDEEKITNFKDYLRNEVMQNYAENFNKGLGKDDIKYYGMIHTERGKDSRGIEEMHAHIVVSRKDMENKMKLSPMTNHKNTSNGAVKGGFNRANFKSKNEDSFDKKFSYSRPYSETFEYANALKNGNLDEKMAAIEKRTADDIAREKHRQQEAEKSRQTREEEQGRELAQNPEKQEQKPEERAEKAKDREQEQEQKRTIKFRR